MLKIFEIHYIVLNQSIIKQYYKVLMHNLPISHDLFSIVQIIFP